MSVARLIPSADYRVMPWRNGLGETVEIARSPSGSTGLDDFDWRVSVAPVVADGAFSVFPGIERTIVVIEGNGMELSLADGRTHRLMPFEPFTYDGGMQVHGRLLDGPVRDMNLMVRRGSYRGRLQLVREPVSRQAWTHTSDVRLIIAYAHSGDFACDGTGWSERVSAGNTLLIEGSSTFNARALAGVPCLAIGAVAAVP